MHRDDGERLKEHITPNVSILESMNPNEVGWAAYVFEPLLIEMF